jgi:hypothetical protein
VGRSTGITGPSPAMRTWHQTLGARDVVSGLAMTFAPAGPALRAATLFRIVSDATDALSLRWAGRTTSPCSRPTCGWAATRTPTTS